jgi:UDP-N-acetylmuramate dehydrogenase
MSIARLRAAAGENWVENAPVAQWTTYRVGGTARYALTIPGPVELREWAEYLPDLECSWWIFGQGSNTLVADAGFDGVAIRMGEGFAHFEVVEKGDLVEVTVGPSMSLPVLARRLADAGITGFEWAVGVPGSMGGATVMNAGGHGSDMAASVVSAEVLSLREGTLRHLTREELDYGYRRSALGHDDLVCATTLALSKGSRDDAKRELKEIVSWRREHQPGGSNAGSVFRNPVGHSAGAVIEQCGLKGRRHGSAVVSEKHANFIQVDDHGSADDVYALMCEVAVAVREQTGITLESEIRLLGFEGAR